MDEMKNAIESNNSRMDLREEKIWDRSKDLWNYST